MKIKCLVALENLSIFELGSPTLFMVIIPNFVQKEPNLTCKRKK